MCAESQALLVGLWAWAALSTEWLALPPAGLCPSMAHRLLGPHKGALLRCFDFYRRQSSFADFKVSGVQKVYQDALYSLQLELLAHRRRVATMHKQQQQHMQPPQLTPQQLQQLTPLAAAAAAAAAAGSSGATGLAAAVTLGEEALELQLVQLLLGLLCAEFEAGYCEHALAKIQVRLDDTTAIQLRPSFHEGYLYMRCDLHVLQDLLAHQASCRTSGVHSTAGPAASSPCLPFLARMQPLAVNCQ